MLTQASVGAVTWWFQRHDTRRSPDGAPTTPTGSDGPAAHAWVALGVWVCFGGGAVLGALAHRALDEWALVLPAATLAVIALAAPSLVRPTASG
jgi:uncharacterized membrane protein YoaK (UPF0700 family)